MNHTYVIQKSSSKWNVLWDLLLYPVYFYFVYSMLFREWNEFSDLLSFKKGWLLFIFSLIWITVIVSSLYSSVKFTVITINDDIIQYSLVTGNNSTSPEVITKVLETSCSYNLYSDLRQIFLSKRSIPEDLAQIFQRLSR